MTPALLFNILFSIVVCTMLVGLLAWAIATQRNARTMGSHRLHEPGGPSRLHRYASA